MSEDWQTEMVKQAIAFAFTTTGKAAEYLWKRLTDRVPKDAAAVERAVRTLIARDPDAARELHALMQAELPVGRALPRVATHAARLVDRHHPQRQLHGRTGTAVLSGPPGIGKSELARHVGASGGYPGGAILVDCAEYRDGPGMPLGRNRIKAYVLARLGVETISENDSELAAQYDDVLAPLQVLLIFDNVESAQELHRLVPPAPMSLVLALTSAPEDDFLLEFGSPIVLGPLEEGADGQLLEGLCPPGLAARDPEGFEALLTQCDRVPQVLVVAAHLVRQRESLSPRPFGAVAEELRSGGSLPVVSLAYDEMLAGLSSEAAELCRLLTAFPGPSFTAEVVDVLAGKRESSTSALVELQSKVFVTVEADGRLRLASQARQAVRRAGDTRGINEARARLLQYYAARAVDADWQKSGEQRLRLYPGRSQGRPFADDPVDWLAAEMPVYRALAAVAREWGFHRELAQFGGALEIVPLHRNAHRDFEEILRHCIEDADDPALLARLTSQHGRLLSLLGEFGRAAEAFTRAEAELRRIPDPGTDRHQQLAASVLEFQGLFHREQQQFDLAAGYYQAALDISRRLSVPGTPHRGRGLHARMLANVLVVLNRPKDALDLLREAEQNTDPARHRDLAQVRLVQAKVLTATGRAEEALALVPEVWQLAVRARSDQYDLEIGEALGDAAWRAGGVDLARQHWFGVWQRYEAARHPRRERLYRKQCQGV
ncbi:hypothetical protein [Amycolatopsis jejuensis]|uniref:hypothetical protein n=1 Tax=Amycolatopsis jejuensis TaxID=330084 RepID=UPI000525A8C9|nr:hypothetical protein [Amycolatopsis jejuensis]